MNELMTRGPDIDNIFMQKYLFYTTLPPYIRNYGSDTESQTIMSRIARHNLRVRVIRPGEEEVTQPLENKEFTTTIIFGIATAFLSLVVIHFFMHIFLRTYLFRRAFSICVKEGVPVDFAAGFHEMKLTPVLHGDELQTAGYRLDDHIIKPAEFENKGFIRQSWKAITSLPLRVFNFITRFDLVYDTLNYYEKKGVLVAVEVGILGAKVTPVLRGDELEKEVALVAVEVRHLRAKVTPVLYQK
ncbi:hypothetical protein HS088_TW19G00116 [Tripterygium wilfordii]|uniref:Uncharacterized protein n=1 Tax=Tripterygium wilfordii TaxID=458696 RepID=A0A7J7C9B4_TRIWF|nr:hypothetical protein HS088_TW19G00116 [Tripterygium wilfordii]